LFYDRLWGTQVLARASDMTKRIDFCLRVGG
jgi:hypothetical protein